MKLLLCKVDKEPEVVELNEKHDYKDIKKLLGIESPITVVDRKIGNKRYDLWIDDEGLLKSERFVGGVCLNYEELLCGNILIANHDGKGNIKGLTDDDLKNILKNGFVSSNEGMCESIEYSYWGVIKIDGRGQLLLYKC